MSVLNNSIVPASAGGYEIDNSLRFNDDDSAYLSWTPSSAGNRKTWTWSGWLKPSTLVSSNNDGGNTLFAVYQGSGANYLTLVLDSSGRFNLHEYDTNSVAQFYKRTQALFRDPSNWYHINIAVDSTQVDVSNRIKIYVNNVQITIFDYSADVSQNYETLMSTTTNTYIGGATWSNGYLDGYLAEVNFIDGQALTPDNFGETDATYGHWKPIEYTGTYGTNGFYLNFAGGGIMSATGGTITTDGDYKVHSFTTDGTFTPSVDGYVEYLVIGGGGNGAGYGASMVSGGGGGAGGFRTGYLAVTKQAYSITVGAATEDSVFSSITSVGGGNGGQPTPTSGGSGGGSGASSPSGAAGTSGQGNTGGTGTGNWGYTTTRSGGGGGSGGAGGNSDGTNGGAGGAGTASSITGSSVTYAAGGEGVAHTRSTAGTPGAANTGNGGGGTGGTGGNSGGAGGTGIVIIRYKFQ